MEPRFQNTLSKPVTLTGFGYWSGQDVTVEFRPAAVNTGIRFVRCDLPDQPAIPAHVDYRTQSPRRTSLRCGSATVEMVEHIMAALYGMQIDNCQVVVNRAEMPGFDGSSQTFVEALQQAGLNPQPSLKSQIVVTDSLRIGDDEKSWIQIEPCHDYRVTYHLDYPQPQIGRQSRETPVTRDSFCDQISRARTFLLEHEAQWLLQQGLGARVSYQHVLVFDDQGPIENELRYEDECVRHKTLDVIGDFALCGHEIIGHVTASRSGHRLNGELVRRLLQHGSVQHEPSAVSYTEKTA